MSKKDLVKVEAANENVGYLCIAAQEDGGCQVIMNGTSNMLLNLVGNLNAHVLSDIKLPCGDKKSRIGLLKKIHKDALEQLEEILDAREEDEDEFDPINALKELLADLSKTIKED